MTTKNPAAPAILRRRAVQERTGLSRSGIYAAIKAGTFPAQIALGPRAVGWLDSSISAWIDDRIKATNATTKGEAK